MCLVNKNYCTQSHPQDSKEPVTMNIPYFLDYKMHFPPQIWEENGGASYSPNVVYLAHWGLGGWGWSEVFFSYFPPLKPRYCLWSGASYSPKI